jgi:hypothetical protein
MHSSSSCRWQQLVVVVAVGATAVAVELLENQ